MSEETLQCLMCEKLGYHVCDSQKKTIPHSWAQSIAIYGSKRRVIELYWKGQLTPEHERYIEENTKPEELIGFKPIV